MLSEIRQDRSALRWIRGELDQSLREARASLELFAEGQQARLDECADILHHVHGALEMVQVYGAAMLADEMEQLAMAMTGGRVKRQESAAEALMLGMVQLPAYLEKVEAGGADIPLVLLPLMNDLRAARDAPLVSETSLFAPKLNTVIAAETVRPGSGNRDMPRLIHEHRSQYHRGLLGWIRNQNIPASLELIRDVLDLLNSAAGTARFRRLLDAAEALTIALGDDQEAPALAVKPLFGKLDQVFKRVIDQGEEAAMLDFPVELLKNLLYYIARSSSRDPAVVSVKQAADLVNSFPDPSQTGNAVGSLGAPDRELFGAVGDALSQDLRDVKDQLDLYIRGDRSMLDRLAGLARPVQRIADTLGMVGRGDLRSRLKQHGDELNAARESAQPMDDERLMALASELLFVESSLASLESGVSDSLNAEQAAEGASSQMLSEGEMRQHQHAAIDEALVEIAKTKDDILEYLGDPAQAQRLSGVPARLHMVAGVMAMLQMPEAGRLLHDLKPYLLQLADGARNSPDVAERDAIADVITSAELYMQSAVEPGVDRNKLLAYADRALQVLGLRDVTAGAEPEPVAAEAEPAAPDHPAPGDERAAVEPESEFEAAPETDRAEEVETVDQRPAVPELTIVGGAPEPATPTGVMETETAAETVEAPPAESGQPVDDDSDDVDSEILEIFAEEAEEELAVVQRCLPQWRNNPDDRESLQTMRRSFHTLKGSGRIVGASNIGEFSWAVENLLNRVIDGTAATSPDVLSLMDEVAEVLPALVAESQVRGASETDVSGLSARAFALASGEAVSPVADAAVSPSSAPSAESETPVEALASFGETAAEATLTPAEQFDAPIAASLDESIPSETGEALPLPDDDLTTLSIPGTDFAEPVFAEAQEPLSLEGLGQGDDEPMVLENLGSERSVFARQGDGPDESILTASEVQDSEFTEHDANAQGAADSSLSAVFANEAQGHLKVLDDFILRCANTPGGCEMEAGVRRAMHTLRGSSRTAGFEEVADLSGELEAFSEMMQNQQRRTDGHALDLLNRCHGTLTSLTAALEGAQVDTSGWEGLRDEVARETAAMAEAADSDDSQLHVDSIQETPDPELLEIFLDEAKELLEALDGELNDWEDAVDDNRPVAILQRNLHTMKGGARLAGVSSVGDLSHALESVFESVVERRVAGGDRLKHLVRHATDALAQDIEQLIGGGIPSDHPAMVERLEAAARGREWDDVAAAEASILSDNDLSELLNGDAGDESAMVLSELSDDAESGVLADAVGHDTDIHAAPDQATGETESVELVSEAETDAGPESKIETEAQPEPVDALQDLGESEIESSLLTDSQLMTDSELLNDSSFLLTPSAEAEAEQASSGFGGPAPSSVAHLSHEELTAEEGEGFVERKPVPEEPAAPSGGSERVRVASESLDQMVNNAGEVSIYRARIEQQNGSIAFNLGELQQTIDRLRGQLRGLELETEAQILSRHEREDDVRADFDPLEMDRYSTIQQLSRALSETVEDLSNLGQSLNDLSRDTDTLLLQQARVTTDLQDGLLRTRMVRFASRVPRLERVVRQTSHSVGKQANLEVVGGEEDMDRAILERMMGPLEHLLRNAVSHGIEDPETRTANDKPAQGLITLQLAREGTDVVLTLSDDGAGLDRSRIRDKAVERGLLDADAQIDDDDLYQLILQPGFSTAQALSQVSGRGVGMDVVLTEVKQLGGTLEIDSQPGSGTSFTIRLPFTLAITDALLVAVGEDFYAVPHSSMDGVARINVEELRAIYAGRQESFSYGGRDYSVRYLGSMLGMSAPNILEGARWLPLMLVRSGEHRVAIHVDSLLGNRQIVVKSIGAQLSGVRWFTGGTIMADGQIALILDTNSLVRMDSTAGQAGLDQGLEAPVSRGVSVMVVDDSITVRKVTSRLLERHNMQVVTAKDGVDAATLLQEQHPDVMLLDIEMPRMDGYELARHIRSTPELADIPIIMITSRTGDKHRQRAMELGVQRYLGKPYQEAELLENIYTVLADNAL